jgi:GNAT superfamily N-acetyltransferase
MLMLSEAITKDQIEVVLDGIEPISTSRDSLAAAATGIITLAFASDPVARWTYPDADQYLKYFPAFVNALAGPSFTRGTAYIAPDGGGAALWLGPGVDPNEDELLGHVWSSTSDEVQKDLFPIFEQMAAFHPSESHWYLPMIGVEPGRQGSGIGSALLQHTLATCDEDGLPAYLESTNPKNIPLYERFGFEQIGVIRSGDAPPLFPMLRKPQRAWDDDISKTKS